MLYERDCIGMIGSLCSHCWTLELNRLFWLMEECDANTAPGLPVLAHANEIVISVADDQAGLDLILKTAYFTI